MRDATSQGTLGSAIKLCFYFYYFFFLFTSVFYKKKKSDKLCKGSMKNWRTFENDLLPSRGIKENFTLK